MFWGAPGIGKSSVVNQAANELGFIKEGYYHLVDGKKIPFNNFIDMRLAQVEPSDLRGVPMPDRESSRAVWFLPEFWPTRSTESGVRVVVNPDGEEEEIEYKAGSCPFGPGLIFLDEIEKAPISVKNAALQLVLDRKLGSYHLPDDWSIVCAGNREEDGAFSQPLGSALANRMLHIEVEPKVEDWAAWARENNVLEDIIGFLYFKSDLLYKQNDDHAFPTPRSWVMGSRMIQNAKTSREQKEILQAAVGVGAAQEFTVWQSVYKSVDPEAVLKGQMPDFTGQDQSFKYAVALAVSFHLRKRKNNIKGIEENVAKFLKSVPAELRVVFLKQQKLTCLEAMIKNKHFESLVKEMMSVVT